MNAVRAIPLLLPVLVGCRAPEPAAPLVGGPAPAGRLPNLRIRQQAAAIDLRRVRAVVFEFETETPPDYRHVTTHRRGEIAAIRQALLRSSREWHKIDTGEPGTEATRADSIEFVLSGGGSSRFSIAYTDPVPNWGPEVGRIVRLYKRRNR